MEKKFYNLRTRFCLSELQIRGELDDNKFMVKGTLLGKATLLFSIFPLVLVMSTI